MPLRVALAAGHHNDSGGNAVEAAIVGELCELYAASFRRHGVDVRVITPDGPDADGEAGDGKFPGTLSAVAAKVVEWFRQGWEADLFLELHTEGVAVRGSFGVYPDWDNPDDWDWEAADLGEEIAHAIDDAVGIPVRGGGSMSEKATGVGRSGYRLGVFAVTQPISQVTTRLIMEHGAHAHLADLAILQDPAKQKLIAEAAVEAIMRHYSAQSPTITFSETGITMNKSYGFYQFWEAHGGLPIFGYPITDEVEEGGRTVQYFERARFELHPDGKGGNVVMLGRVGAELLELRGHHEKVMAPNQSEGGD